MTGIKMTFKINTAAANGRCKTVKIPNELKFKRLKDSLVEPPIVDPYFSKNSQHLHALWKALYTFEKKVNKHCRIFCIDRYRTNTFFDRK